MAALVPGAAMRNRGMSIFSPSKEAGLFVVSGSASSLRLQ
jgi:hypothetical protein